MKNQAYLLYNMCLADNYDPILFAKFEESRDMASSEHMTARHCYGALYAYYKTGMGTQAMVDKWESLLEDHIDGMKAQEVVGLL